MAPMTFRAMFTLAQHPIFPELLRLFIYNPSFAQKCVCVSKLFTRIRSSLWGNFKQYEALLFSCTSAVATHGPHRGLRTGGIHEYLLINWMGLSFNYLWTMPPWSLSSCCQNRLSHCSMGIIHTASYLHIGSDLYTQFLDYAQRWISPQIPTG